MTTDFVRNLDKPLLQLTPKDAISVRASFTGFHAYGATGSGKSSGTAKLLSGALLRAGYGGLVMTAKPDEISVWLAHAKQHGRENSVIVFDEQRHFNFIQYEFSRRGAEAANSVTDILLKVLKAADVAAGQAQGQEGEAIWIKTTREMILNTITVLYSATGMVRIDSIVEFITSMPTAPPSTEEEKKKQVSSYALDRLIRCKKNPVHRLKEHTLKRVRNYWLKQYVTMPEKMRGSITTSVCAELNRFSDGILREQLCTTTDILPEMAFSGGILVMGFPVLSYPEEGLVLQQIFKMMFQRAVESRNGLDPVFQERPLFLFADESQYFISESDDLFLSTCRSSKCSVVYLTQSVSTYYAQLGKKYEERVSAFVSKFGNVIFHSNLCSQTNRLASQLIGRGLHLRRNWGESKGTSRDRSTNANSSSGVNYSDGDSQSEQGNGSNSGSGRDSGSSYGRGSSEGSSHTTDTGTTEQMDDLIETNFFSQHLKTGAEENDFIVTALWLKAGANFKQPMPGASNNVILATFKQR